jgi:hypothetical protein
VVEVLEEIIEFNEQEKSVLNYTVLVEKAQKNLSDYVKIWKNPRLSMEEQEYFSEEKLFYIFFKSMQALEYIHSHNIYYGNMKE